MSHFVCFIGLKPWSFFFYVPFLHLVFVISFIWSFWHFRLWSQLHQKMSHFTQCVLVWNINRHFPRLSKLLGFFFFLQYSRFWHAQRHLAWWHPSVHPSESYLHPRDESVSVFKELFLRQGNEEKSDMVIRTISPPAGAKILQLYWSLDGVYFGVTNNRR